LCVLAGCSNPSGGGFNGGGGGGGNGGFTWTGIDAEDFGAYTANDITRLPAADYAGWNAALKAIEAGGNNANYVITLTGDIGSLKGVSTPTFGSVTGLTVSLRGGKKLSLVNTGEGKGSLLRIRAGQTLILRDVTLEGRGDNDASLVYEAGGSLFMKTGAAIKDNTNTATNGGGGVYVYNGTFNMSGNAVISGNTTTNTSNGSGVVVYSGTFNMSGNAVISGNTAAIGSGGGVFVSGGTFTMSGSAVISGNTATNGGGVFVDSGTFTRSGSSVIYGDSPATTTTAQYSGPNANTATSSSNPGQNGHAVLYYNGTNYFYRNGDPDAGVDITTVGVTTGNPDDFEGYR
jgi:hypothetical protein